MNIQALSDITFDEQDANLFLVDDVRLRADALRHSVLPRLRVVMNAAISLIRDVYCIEALEDSIVSVYPNFRQKRDRELLIEYDTVFVGLGGQRKAKWPGFSRKDGKPVQVLPFRYAFVLDQEGVFTVLENGWLKGVDTRSFEMLLHFHIENEHKINPLCFLSGMSPVHHWDDDIPPLASFRDHYIYRIKSQCYDNHFIGHTHYFPVSGIILSRIVEGFIYFYPVYDSYIQMAKGLPHRLDVLIAKLTEWMRQNMENDQQADQSFSESTKITSDTSVVINAAEAKTRVMPALRWQVFQRDGWKCVACGRNSHDGAILHVDHIIPRSRGGRDSLENFQTLCNVCNIGKGNRDATDLRNKG